MAIKLITATLTLFLVACANTSAQVSTNEAPKIIEPVPEPSSWQFPSVIESARKLTPQNLEGKPFNKFGLAYSTEELNQLDIASLPATSLQNYADIVTHAYPDAVGRQLPSDCSIISTKDLNETSIAGMAYISINAINESTRKKASACLVNIQGRL